MTPPSSPAPSRSLDAEIAERVMGWQRYGAIRYGARCVVLVPDKQVCWTRYTRTKSDPGSWEATTDPITERDSPRYSSDIAAAWQVVEKLNGMNATVEVTSVGEHADANPDPAIWVEVWGLNAIGMETQLARVGDVTAPLAICRAALAAVECA